MKHLVIDAWWPMVLLAVLAALVWVAARHSESGMSVARRRWLTGLRLAAMACVAIALMRPAWLATGNDVSVVYALDVSRSVDPQFVDAAIRWMEGAEAVGKPAQSRFVAFADRATFADSPAAIRKVPLGAGRDGLDPTITDIEAGLDAALYGFTPHQIKRLVLMTDGNATRGDLWNTLDRLRHDNVRVFTVPASVRAGHDAWVEGIDVPAGLHRDEPFIATVRVFSQAATRATLRLERGDKLVAQRQVALVEGPNRIAFTVTLADTGPVRLTAVLAADGDTVPDNDRMAESVQVQGRPRVLYAEGVAESAHFLADALKRDGLDVKTVAIADMPTVAAGFGAYDAVILSDAAAKDVGEARMQALAGYVRDSGGGLLFAAGASTYGESGYRDTALEKVLPVTFEAQEKRRDLALMIVLDRSYSMKGRKLDLAKAATLGALDLLDENHRFGVITFDSLPEMTVPLAPARGKRKAEALISRFTASGQTNIYPALQAAYRALVDVPVKSKHVILLSDGDTQPADFPRLVKRMADAKITVSTVAVGAEADKALMESIAKLGQGRYYFTESAERVPKIFIDETQRLVNQSFIEEPVHAVVRRHAEALRGIDFTTAPALKGFASTKPRDSAELYLVTESGAPLLAHWQVGLGKAVVFTADVKNRWGADWVGWPGYAKLFGQLVRETLRRDTAEETDFKVTRDGGDAVVRLSALGADGAFRNGLAPKVSVRSAGGEVRTVALRQTGPGRYEARVPVADGAGPARFELAESAGVPKAMVAKAGVRELHRAYPAEFRLYPPNGALLRSLSEQTGGKYAPEAREVFAAYGDSAQVPWPLWPWFTVAGLVFYLLDLAVRRLPWAWRRFGGG